MAVRGTIAKQNVQEKIKQAFGQKDVCLLNLFFLYIER